MSEEDNDDLRSMLAKNFEDATTDTSAAVETKEAPAEPVADDSAADATSTDDRPRGKDGKFAKKEEAADDKAPEPDKKAEPEKVEAEKVEAKTEEQADPDKDKPKVDDPKEKAIARWSASDKAMFRLQSPEAQDFLLRRAQALEGEFTKKTQAIADLKREYEPVQQIFSPYGEVLKQKGLTPASVIQRWANVETDLASGDPQRQLRIVAGIIQGYGINPSHVAQALGIKAGAQPQQGAQPDPQAQQAEDPAAQLLAQLEERIAQSFAPKLAKIDQFEQLQQQTQAAAQQRELDRVDNEINSFKSETDAQGNLAHPYFEEVEQDMTALAQAYKAMGQPIPPLAELYDRAVNANPSTRQALLATHRAAQEAKAAEEARAKAASARRAASSVSGAPGPGQTARPVRSDLDLRSQLEEAFGDLSQ